MEYRKMDDSKEKRATLGRMDGDAPSEKFLELERTS